MSRVRAFFASSLDGFIAGPKDEIDWLPGADVGMEDTFTPFFAQIGALLMGRRSFDVACGFEGEWPYGDKPVLVATTRPMVAPRASVRAVSGDVAELVAQAKQTAAERDVYIDGGVLMRSALDAGLIDEITMTVIPIVLGAGLPAFAGTTRRHALELIGGRPIGGGLVELRYAVVRAT